MTSVSKSCKSDSCTHDFGVLATGHAVAPLGVGETLCMRGTFLQRQRGCIPPHLSALHTRTSLCHWTNTGGFRQWRLRSVILKGEWTPSPLPPYRTFSFSLCINVGGWCWSGCVSMGVGLGAWVWGRCENTGTCLSALWFVYASTNESTLPKEKMLS